MAYSLGCLVSFLFLQEVKCQIGMIEGAYSNLSIFGGWRVETD